MTRILITLVVCVLMVGCSDRGTWTDATAKAEVLSLGYQPRSHHTAGGFSSKGEYVSSSVDIPEKFTALLRVDLSAGVEAVGVEIDAKTTARLHLGQTITVGYQVNSKSFAVRNINIIEFDPEANP